MSDTNKSFIALDEVFDIESALVLKLSGYSVEELSVIYDELSSGSPRSVDLINSYTHIHHIDIYKIISKVFRDKVSVTQKSSDNTSSDYAKSNDAVKSVCNPRRRDYGLYETK